MSDSPREGGQLRGKTVLVTGGSRGIGAAIVQAVARAGADVAFTWLSEESRAQSVERDARGFGGRSVAYQCDVSDPAQVRALVASTETDLGPLDGLVNNAGIMPITPFLEMSDEEWGRVLQTDLYGPFVACRAVLPGMLERRRGSIVNLSSRLAYLGAPNLAHYITAKAGVIGLTKALAREFGPLGIRVNAVAPGPTLTDMGRTQMSGAEGERKAAELAIGRFPEPKEVAAAVVFLLSDDASSFTGQTLHPNGGGFMA